MPNATGTYDCGSGSSYRALNIWFYWNLKYHLAGPADRNGPTGSRCSITVTQASGTFEGTFEGTFVTEDGTGSLTVANGRFRFIGP